MSNTDNEQLTKREQGLDAISELIHAFNSEFKNIRAQYDISDISLYVTEKNIINPCLLKAETVKQSLPDFFNEHFTGLGFVKKNESEFSLFHLFGRELVVRLTGYDAAESGVFVFNSILRQYNDNDEYVSERSIYDAVIVSKKEEIDFLHKNSCIHRIAMGDTG